MGLQYEPSHDQTSKWALRPLKTKISLGICPVWSESSLSAWRKVGSLATHWAHSEDSDQTGRMPRLIWVFAGRTDHIVGFVMQRIILPFRCTVFVSSHSVNKGETTKLLRDQPTVVFDFHNYFRPALEKYIHSNGPKPSFEVIVGFGQRFQLEKDSVSNLLISATLVHSYACDFLTMVGKIQYFTFLFSLYAGYQSLCLE